VGVEVVRELYGVVQVEKATAGIVATTSHFTKGAKDLQSQLSYQMSLKDYVDVQEWLRSALRRKSTI
jgi:restriction system protein